MYLALQSSMKSVSENSITANREAHKMSDMKECPFCTRQINKMASVCRYCYMDLTDSAIQKKGGFARVRVRTGDKIYVGDIFVPEHHRVSDVINSHRRFIVLSNVFNVRETRDIGIGQLAINKERTKSIYSHLISHNGKPTCRCPFRSS